MNHDETPAPSAEPAEHRHAPIELARFSAFSDGVFAIAATLLVLELHVPQLASGLSQAAQEGQMWQHLLGLSPQLGAFLLSFWLIGREWILHSRYTYPLRHANTQLGARNLWFLVTISLLPFTTALLGTQGNLRVVWWTYLANLILMDLSLLGLLKELQRSDDATAVKVRHWQESSRQVVVVLLVLATSALLTFWKVYVAQLSMLLLVLSPQLERLVAHLYRGRTPTD